VHKPLPPPTWNLVLVDLDQKFGQFFSSQKTSGLVMSGWAGVGAALSAVGDLFGAYFGAGLVLPKLVKKDLPFKKSLGVAALASLAVGVAAKTLHVFVSKYEFIGKNIPHFGLTEIFYVTFFLFVVEIIKEELKEIKEKYLNEKSAILDGQMRLSFITDTCKENNLTNYEIILFDCNNEVRSKRLIDRGHPELVNPDMMNWAKHLREEAKNLNARIIDNSNQTQEESVREFCYLISQ
jgi:hypothetical protein